MKAADFLGGLTFSGVEKDCEKVQEGDVYFCLTSDKEKAKKCCEIALSRGAACAFCGMEISLEKCHAVEDVRADFADACANFYGNPANELTTVGVTGTNGKTTTTHLVASILKSSGINAGVIGTSGVFYNGKKFDCPLTTPDADFLQKTMREMKDSGVQVVVMEVSAHAIDQKRTHGITFDIGVLTNITQDHLDYFGDFSNYENAKLSFFTLEHMKSGVVCIDDFSAQKLLQNCAVPLTTYGVKNPADVFAMDEAYSMDGTHFVANLNDHILAIKTNLVGHFNVLNSLAALAVCQKLGLNDEQLARGLGYVLPVEGRFNVVNLSGKHVVIDFAHSPDSLKNVLQLCKKLTDKKVLVVFGCGGNRDRDKRHKMGRIAEKYADFVCLTNDNPRTEEPREIVKDIESGMKSAHVVELDRAQAIKKTIELAGQGDIVLIAGKGAEKYQEIGTEKFPYNDFDVVYNIFKDESPTKFRGKEWK